jgi:antitoxin YefM
MDIMTAENISLAALISKVNEDRDSIVITDSKGKSMVALSLEDYESLMETFYLLSSDTNAKHIFDSIKEYEENKVKTFAIEELSNLVK